MEVFQVLPFDPTLSSGPTLTALPQPPTPTRQYAEGGTLRDHLNSGTLTDHERTRIVSQIAAGMYYLHDQKVRPQFNVERCTVASEDEGGRGNLLLATDLID